MYVPTLIFQYYINYAGGGDACYSVNKQYSFYTKCILDEVLNSMQGCLICIRMDLMAESMHSGFTVTLGRNENDFETGDDVLWGRQVSNAMQCSATNFET